MPLFADGKSNCCASRIVRFVGSSTIVVCVADVEMMLPGKPSKFTSVLLYEKLVFISQ